MKLDELEKSERRWKQRSLFRTRRPSRIRPTPWLLLLLMAGMLAMLFKPSLVSALTEFLP